MSAPESITIRYTNWRGETSDRVIQPLRIWWGNTEWHPENQWMLEAVDVEKRANRDFALRDIVFRADLYDAQAAEIADLRRQLAEAANRLDWCAGLLHSDKARDQASEWADESRALTPKGDTP